MLSQKTMSNRRAFTLVEIIITVAIIAIVSSLAIPGYIKARMNANMTLVQQQMRIIGEKMIEILGRKGKFPDPSTWWESMKTSPDPDEVSITGNLSAIEYRCYSTYDYSTNEPRTSYRFCSAPQAKPCGQFSGNKRFCVHADPELSAYFAPGTVGALSAEIDKPWEYAFDFQAVGIEAKWFPDFADPPYNLSSNPEKLVKWFEQLAYFLEIRQIESLKSGEGGIKNPSGSENMGYEALGIRDVNNFNRMLAQVLPMLREKGIDVSVRREGFHTNEEWKRDYLGIGLGPPADWGGDTAEEFFSSLPNPDVVTLGFRFLQPEKRIHTLEEAAAKQAEICSDPDVQIFCPHT